MKIKEWYKKYEDEVAVVLAMTAMIGCMFTCGYYLGMAKESIRYHEDALKYLDAYLKAMEV